MNTLYDNEDFFQAYSQMDRSRGGLSQAGEWHQLEPLFPQLHGKQVLDLGCGYGWHCRYAAEHGAARVLGIDLSEKMIREARKRNPAPAVTYRVCGMQDYEYPANSFDLVLSNLALHYLENLDEIYGRIYKTLKPEGIFLFNIEHPVFTSGINQDWIYQKGRPFCWPVDNYFYPGKRSVQFLGRAVQKYHHTLTQILMGLLHSGFHLDAVEEAEPSPSMLDRPGMAEEMRRPMMLLVKARRV